MSNNQVVIDTLKAKREQLIAEKNKLIRQYQDQIEEIEEALTLLSGGPVWDQPKEVLYDDESPTYISGTEDGI